jgi:phosphoglycolate phosphatase-like HAD superfamily hydrolase
MDISQYATLIFDCDGVILNSNKIKTTAFYNAALPYGEDAAEALVKYHKKHGGISRYAKFEYFLEEILGLEVELKKINNLLSVFASEIQEELILCQISPGLEELRKNSNSNWLVVSGSYQKELRCIFSERNLTVNFNCGIFGSPETKEVILSREIDKGNIKFPALFIGDSKYDYQVTKATNIDFVFAYDWSEVNDWREYCDENDLKVIKNLAQLQDSSIKAN